MEVERLTAVLDASGLGGFQTAMQTADRVTDSTKRNLGALAEVSKIATDALQRVKMTTAQAAETSAVSEAISRSVSGVTAKAVEAADRLAQVKLDARQAAESKASAEGISEGLNQVSRNADQTKRKLEEVRLAGGRNGVGVGPVGSGYGRIGLMGAAVGAGTLLGPAAGPGAAGLLAAVPTLAAGGAGAIGTLMLAFHGLGKAIDGDEKAFKSLNPQAQQLVQTIRSLDGWVDQLQQTADKAMFPGLTKGLHDALSPGTVQAIATAVREFGSALGGAGEEWGKFFGSTRFQQTFGPLMQAGAQNVTVMSGAALSLFDALGQIARAAIPFTSWLTRSVADGARLVDVWASSGRASGSFASGLDEARTSLTLVWRLLESLIGVVGALGQALYPVSKVAVKDLTDGLNALAGMIDRNQGTIRQIVGGALAALVQTVKIATPLVHGLAVMLGDVVSNVGGWKNAFEIVLAGVLVAKLGALLGKVKSIGTAIGLIPAQAKTAAAETDTQLATIGSTAETTAGKVAGIRAALKSIAGTVVTVGILLSLIPKTSKGQQALDSAGLGFLGHVPVIGGLATQSGALGADARGRLGLDSGASGPTGSVSAMVKRIAALEARKPKGWQSQVSELEGIIAGLNAPNTSGMSNDPMHDAGGGSTSYRQQVAAVAKQYGIPVGIALAQINQESGFNPTARSGAGAEGIAQFMPGTAAEYGVKDPYDPQQALQGYGKMMSQLIGKYGVAGALSAYNSGNPSAYLNPNFANGQTYNYVKNIMSAAGMNASTTSPFGTPPPFTKNTKVPGAAAAHTLAQNLKQLHSQLTTVGGQVNTDLEQKLISPEAAAALRKQVDSINASLKGAGKDALPGIRTNLSQLKSQLSAALAQAVDARGLDKTVASIHDDLKNKLLSRSDANELLKNAAAYNKTLTDNLISPAARRKVEENVSALKKQLTLDLSLQTQRTSLAADVATLNAAITADLYPPDVVAKAKKLAAEAGRQIGEGTAAGLAAAKGTIRTLGKSLPVVSGSALLPTSMASSATAAANAAKADSTIVGVLAGAAATSFQSVVRDDLINQASSLQDEVTLLKSKLAVTTGRQKTAIQAELTSVSSSLDSVQQQVTQALQTTVTQLQSNVTTIFGQVQAEIEAQLGAKYFQNGLQTPSEALLAQMQAQDQAQSLQDALAAANKQLVSDTAGIGTLFDSTTGAYTAIANSAGAAQIAADQKAVQMAQRQLDEYNLSIKAAGERADADKTYAAQLKGLDRQLSSIQTAFENGTGSIAMLTGLATAYGIQIDTKTIPDMQNLSTASGDLLTAFQALYAWVFKTTQSIPAPVATSNAQALASAVASGASVQQQLTAAQQAGYTQSLGFLQRAGIIGSFAAGGPTGSGGLSMLHDDEYVVPKGGALVKSGGGGGAPIQLNLSVQALDPASVDWDAVAARAVDAFHSAFLRKQRRNGGTLGLN